uniref:Protein-tyrosine-phosphatase n=1 Tax=Syphacia muris TaxID=451379 RepID=A0A0N5ADY0_9BILA
MKSIIFNISEILPHLFLSGFGCALEKNLHQLGITHVVDASNMIRNVEYKGIKYMYVKIYDSEDSDILQYIDGVIEFIEEARKSGGKTLVYCAAGVSRSATLCIMYVMKNKKISLKESFLEVSRKRPIISPNIGFWKQMIDYEFKEYGKKSVNLIRDRGILLPDVYFTAAKVQSKGLTLLEDDQQQSNTVTTSNNSTV